MRCSTMLGRHFAHEGAARIALAVIALLSSAALGFADPRAAPDTADTPDASEPQGATSAPNFGPLSAEAQAALRDALNFDAHKMPPTSPLRVRTPNVSGHDLDWNHTDKGDGSAAVSVKKPLPLMWDTKIGADFGLAPTPATSYQANRLLQSNKDQGSGAAWATVTVPGLASIDARVDPSKEQSRLGTTFSRSLPFGTNYSLTLQSTFALTETLGSTPAGPVLPNTAAPAPFAQPLAQVWSNDRLVKFNIHSTGTTLAAGQISSTADYMTHNKILAEQKLFGPLSVTTAVTDVGTPISSKSIAAGFKFKW